MARSINSPGVQITETDLSNYQTIGGGTTVFVPGFAAQGPTDEVLLISTAAELEQIYGIPETAAERYFYYSAKEVLNSPSTLLTTRLPYGSGSGGDFANQYSALLYPVASASTGFTIHTPTHITINETEYNDMIQGNITWSSLSSVQTTASYTSGTNTVNAGIVVLNSAQTTVNELFEGYYVSLADNTNFGPTTNFDSITFFRTLTSVASGNPLVGSFATINQTNQRLGFSLSGDNTTAGQNSISEVIETTPTYNFGDAFYKDSLILNVFKVRNSIYEPQVLTYSLAETHIGSLDSSKKTLANNAGAKTFFLENIVNTASPNIKVLVNPGISTNTNWTGLSSNVPAKSVEVNTDNKAMYSVGVYSPTFERQNNKQTGGLKSKVERVLSLIESTESIDIDVIIDAGLSTVFANTSGTEVFDDTKFYSVDLTSETSNTTQRWRTIFNTFNDFVTNVRKDCVFISDPVRQIFVNGANTKTLSQRNKTFSTDIYTPLKSLYSSINSSYAATYGNWVKVYDSYSDTNVWLPPSGYVASTYSRTDATAQPWIAPAGLTRGTINGIIDLAFNPNQKQRDFLYTISVNPVVSFVGDGFVIFGQKTLQSKPSAFDRVNVRRLFLTLERATQKALKYFVFEPNSEFTRSRLKNTIRPIFDLAKNTEGLYDYLIVCDERNNTDDVIDRNELAVDIYIKPVKAAEFILVNFIATRTGQNFQELI